MKQLIIFLMLCLAIPCRAQLYNQETEKILAKLDSILPLRGQYEQNKLKRISGLKANAAQRKSDEERFWDYGKLYDEYFTYDSDSAHKYVDKSIAIAQKLGNQDWENEWKIKKALLLVNTGLMGQANELAIEIRPTLKPEILAEYYNLMFGMNYRYAQYSDGSPDVQKQYEQEALIYRDSILMVMRPDHPDYIRLKSGTVQEQKDIQEMTVTLENELAQSSLSTRQDALNAITLSYLYQYLGNTDGYLQNLARSAIADIRATNSDIDSLDGLSQALFEIGDLDHAYLYITNCLNIIRTYGNRVHLLRLTAVQEGIYKAYIERGRKLNTRMQHLATITGILAFILLLSVCIIIHYMVKQRISKRELDEKNHLLQQNITEIRNAHDNLNRIHNELETANDKLVQLNTKLQEANYIKEEYIGYVFSICSNYISKLDEFRKDINRKAKTKMFSEIKEMTDSPSISQNELKEFYQNFDAIFLNVYPNFVADFNKLLQPEYQFNLKDGEGLNTELRIFALVKLGITDCVKISDFLHCSSQTVYNYRLRIRNHSLITDKKEFAEAVQSIGRATVL